MGFDGVYRPNSTPDALNPYLADRAARSANAKKPQVKQSSKKEEVVSVYKELPQYGDDEEKEGQEFSEEEIEKILQFATMRGIMHSVMNENATYEFKLNEETGLIDLIDQDNDKTVMHLTPDEMAELMQKILRYTSVLTDRAV